jgi:hypothetical protein
VNPSPCHRCCFPRDYGFTCKAASIVWPISFTLRAELRALGVNAEIVQRGEDYDYTIVFVQDDAKAAAVALDRQGLLATSAVDAAYRVRGATRGAARKLARN